MSIDALRWAWQQDFSDLSAIEGRQPQRTCLRILLVSLADRADENHSCYPSITRLCKDTCMERKAVMRYLGYLEILGLVRAIRQSGMSNRYQLQGVNCRHSTSPSQGTGGARRTRTPQGTGTSPPQGTNPPQGTSPPQGTRTSPSQGMGPVPCEGHKPTRTPNEPPGAAVAAPAGQKFAMHLEWQPGDQFADLMTFRGIPPDMLTDDLLAEFKTYWLGEPHTRCTQGGWEHKLTTAIKRFGNQPQTTERDSHGNRQRSFDPIAHRQSIQDAIVGDDW